MKYNSTYWIARPSTKEEELKMKRYKEDNINMSYNNKSENRMQGILTKNYKETWYKFTRQANWWFRIFDFWCDYLWVVIEVDGWYHQTEYQKNKDNRYDKYHYEVNWIKVYRIKPYDDCWAVEMIKIINKEQTWKQRRMSLWLNMTERIKKDTIIENNKKFIDYIQDINAWSKTIMWSVIKSEKKKQEFFKKNPHKDRSKKRIKKTDWKLNVKSSDYKNSFDIVAKNML